MEWPQLFRQQETGWMVACMVRTAELDKVQGGISQVMRSLLHVFWSSDGFNLERTGMRCPRPSGPLHLRGTLAGILADEKGLKDVFSVKGSSGTKPCLLCKNIVTRLDLP